jgi:hypothetical protein
MRYGEELPYVLPSNKQATDSVKWNELFVY